MGLALAASQVRLKMAAASTLSGLGWGSAEQLGTAVSTALAFFVGGRGAGVLLATSVVGIALGAGEAHLNKLPGHVGSHKIVSLQIFLKQAVNCGRRPGTAAASQDRRWGRILPL